MNKIELKNISKVFRGGSTDYRVLDSINLKINAGDFLAIMGPSGSGKSTLMHIIGALLKPTSGSYRFEGEEIASLTESGRVNLRKNKIGFVFQSFNLISKLSVLENVELPMIYKRVSSKKRKARALEILDKVGLKKRVSFKPNKLSGGEMQRVAIARALANEPEVILADEPTGNLDSKSGDEIMKIFEALNKEGITIILVTHEEDKARFARKIIKLKDGRMENK